MNGAVDDPLGLEEGGADELHLGREPEAVVDQLGELGRQAVAQALHLPVHRDALEVA